MQRWISLKHLLEDEDRYEEFSKLFVSYEPDVRCKNVVDAFSGWYEEQQFETESGLGYHPIKIAQEKIGLISHKATTERLHLMGRAGKENGKMLVDSLSYVLYSSRKLEALAEGLHEDVYKALPEHLKKVYNYSYWMITSENKIKGVCLDGIDECTLRNTYFVYSIRPQIILSNYTMVMIGDRRFDGTTPERALKIKLQ